MGLCANGENARILVAQHDRVFLSALTRGLESAGYQVTESVDGSTAIELAACMRPDLALIDVHMPGMSDLQLAERLGSTHGVPFIILSARAERDIIQRAKALGALGYLVKPLDVPQIVPEIEAALARAAQIRSLEASSHQLMVALESGRETSIAIGILMERRGVDRERAFELLRTHARSQRRRVRDVAAEIVSASEALSRVG